MKKDKRKNIEVRVEYTKLITQFLLCNRCFSDLCRFLPWKKGGGKVFNHFKNSKVGGRLGAVK